MFPSSHTLISHTNAQEFLLQLVTIIGKVQPVRMVRYKGHLHETTGGFYLHREVMDGPLFSALDECT